MTGRTTARALVAGAAVLLAVAGCSGSPASSTSPTTVPTATVKPLTGDLTVFAAASLTGAFDQLLAEFADDSSHPMRGGVFAATFFDPDPPTSHAFASPSDILGP